jgi:hypothetical protein
LTNRTGRASDPTILTDRSSNDLGMTSDWSAIRGGAWPRKPAAWKRRVILLKKTKSIRSWIANLKPRSAPAKKITPTIKKEASRNVAGAAVEDVAAVAARRVNELPLLQQEHARESRRDDVGLKHETTTAIWQTMTACGWMKMT